MGSGELQKQQLIAKSLLSAVASGDPTAIKRASTAAAADLDTESQRAGDDERDEVLRAIAERLRSLDEAHLPELSESLQDALEYLLEHLAEDPGLTLRLDRS